jgi:kynureninase
VGVTTREDCEHRDRLDELASRRERFVLDDATIYLDGNSLGPLTHAARARVVSALDLEWGEGLVRSWNAARWMDAPTRMGDRLAPLIGARAGEVLVADSLTFALAKLIGGALDLRPNRHVVLTDAANFHSDLYIAAAVAQRAGRPVSVRLVERDRLDVSLNDDVALVMLTHVDFRTGEMLDLAEITQKAHAVGALTLWDLAHSAGAVPVDLSGADADFAAGCGYKYLNGGPGSPAFLYIRERWQGVVRNPLPGWLGHARPFAFETSFEPAEGVQAFVTSSPSIIALAALDGALDVWDTVTMDQVRAKSLALTDLFIELVESRLPGAFELATPRDHARRASQVALRHRDAYKVIQSLIERGVIGDFREPDICRFGFAPLYLRFVDVYDAVSQMVRVMADPAALGDRFNVRNAVT